LAIYEFEGKRPIIGVSSFIHPQAVVIGEVEIGDNCYIGAGAVVRGDYGKIVVGSGSNIQENCTLHSEPDTIAILEENVLVGMVAQDIQSGFWSILGVDSIRKGVSVRSSDQGLIVDVHVIVGYGIKIHEVAHNVMQKVAYVLENNAGITIAQVNVNVKGVKVLGEK
jgi:carbonic anhydrase/acetyltransferase-like protein (isoleucine patch superfamily)